MPPSDGHTGQGWSVRIRGQVQGVGFRPFVWQLARQMGLEGDVLNDPEGVLIRTSGPNQTEFVARLQAECPPLARIDALEVGTLAEAPTGAFRIAPSEGAGARTRIAPDAAICADCRREIADATDRRHRHAFANCTNCGPRFTIIDGLPYDRARTSMAAFEMCDICAGEYANPADRRFHAQPVACPNCGPQLWLESGGDTHPDTDVIAAAASALRQGKILAIKGIGGFHLACDACNGAAVAVLRDRKRRPDKPFALMGTLEMITRHSRLSAEEQARLEDPAAPILLLEAEGVPLPDAVAPRQACLGWMLPYTPLHELLLATFGGPLVMTSGNLSGEPQVVGNREAREKLTQFTDLMLMHDRDILRRLDDSVERITPAGPMVLRHARGRVPTTLPLPPGFEAAPQIAAYGGEIKSAICLIKDGRALLSHHLGDLDNLLALDAWRQAERDYTDLFEHRPEVFACDLHPGYRATQFAETRAADNPLIRVQHHHAHLAACLGENLWPRDGGPVAGIVLDGLGLGSDGMIWGGELLLGEYAGFERIAHLSPAPLPGGDAAQREPWRNALVRLDAAGLTDMADRCFAGKPIRLLRRAVASGLNTPLSTSAGRLFDAVAALAGFGDGPQTYEGQAAMELEALAVRSDAPVTPFPFALSEGQIDPAPMFRSLQMALRDGRPAEQVALSFHAGLARAFATPARHLWETGRAQAVALTGGCFQNALLLALVLQELDGIPVLLHRNVPANDGGLALGQALVAAAKADRG